MTKPLTASAISEQVAGRIEVQALLKKPFDSEDLVATVRELSRLSRP